jgi:hypothetical protein
MPVSATQLCANLQRKLSAEAKPCVSRLHFLTSTSASPARISIYTNKRSALASQAKGRVSISRNVVNAPQSSLEVPLEQVTKDRESTYCAKKWCLTTHWMNRNSFEKPRKNLIGYSWPLLIDSLARKRKRIQHRKMLVNLV